MIHDNGIIEWYYYDQLHRLDGPAVLCPSGHKEWAIESFYFSEQDYWNHPKVVEYKLNKILQCQIS